MNDQHKRKLVLGRKKRYLEDCIKVMKLLEKHETPQTVRKRIFYDFIRPEVRVSYPQFNNMMNEKNPNKQLEEVLEEFNSL